MHLIDKIYIFQTEYPSPLNFRRDGFGVKVLEERNIKPQIGKA